MSGVVGALLERKEIPALVRFARVSMPDTSVAGKAASVAAGHVVQKNVDYVYVTAPYSKDEFIQETAIWLDNLTQKVTAGQMPAPFAEHYRAQHAAWLKGEEMPPNGIAIKGWPVISPAEQSNLIACGILTVEMLAQMNSDGLKRYGMGALELKQKAEQWLAQAQDKGPLVLENAKLKQDMSVMQGSLDAMKSQMDAMAAQLEETRTPRRKG